ncbi:hypothetical protein [Fundidesulfovibrio agrisoli]|uniref:hypothetical protein n=1 Tax=Fundidesulfovibrio agrisoli TaxID=2922717 RepID=UPI001FAE5A46|nr:hypothetical protein [Fundidesulfovibrio agrisoli]
MIIVNKGPFAKGAFLMVTFLAVFFCIMSPLFKDQNGKPQNGLEFSDDFFNMLAKNSSDYFDQVKATVAKQKGVQVAVTATVAKPDPKDEPDPAKAQDKANKDAQAYAKALTASGAQVEVKDNVMTIKGDLGAMTEFATAKAMKVFAVVGTDVDKPENLADRKLCKDLWKGFGSMMKPLQKEGKVAEAKVLDTVMRKGLEPAYNFYGVPGEPVSKNLTLLISLLAFYVVYTMWYGYSIFFMFEGVGMSMKKSKKKG